MRTAKAKGEAYEEAQPRHTPGQFRSSGDEFPPSEFATPSLRSVILSHAFLQDPALASRLEDLCPQARMSDMNGLRVGDWVEVRSAEAILATLNSEGSVDALPFMPEMLKYCGRRFRVYKSAHKTCTPPSLLIRSLDNTVHLEGLRCDGEAHGGCQAGCLLFWKEAWLRPVEGPEPETIPALLAQTQASTRPAPSPEVPEVLVRATRVPAADGSGTGERYRCQSTDLVRATKPARWWDPRLLARDLLSGNVRARDFVRYGLIAVLNAALSMANRRPYPFLRPRAGDKTPTASLGLQPGERVEVCSEDEIMATIDVEKQKNRGLRFDVEMWPFCGKSVRVLRRAERFIDERSGRMVEPRGVCLILDDVVCSGNYADGRIFCSRSIYSYWHEVWLRRVEQRPEVDDR